MGLERIGLLVAAGVVLGGLAVTAGCDGGEDVLDDGETAVSASDLRFPRHHRRHDGGGAAGTTGAGMAGNTGAGTGNTGGGTAGMSGGTGAGTTAADCNLCTKAQGCCEAVQAADRPCYFNAGACTADSVNACMVYLNTVRSVWSFEPPSECR